METGFTLTRTLIFAPTVTVTRPFAFSHILTHTHTHSHTLTHTHAHIPTHAPLHSHSIVYSHTLALALSFLGLIWRCCSPDLAAWV